MAFEYRYILREYGQDEHDSAIFVSGPFLTRYRALRAAVGHEGSRVRNCPDRPVPKYHIERRKVGKWKRTDK